MFDNPVNESNPGKTRSKLMLDHANSHVGSLSLTPKKDLENTGAVAFWPFSLLTAESGILLYPSVAAQRVGAADWLQP
jgi:hypothetical protein